MPYSHYNKRMIDNIVTALRDSQVVILPSDTLYGLAANAYDEVAVAKVFAIKQRSENKKLPVHYFSLQQAANDIEITPTIEKLVAKFMPGALTIVAGKKAESQLRFVNDTVAFRIPNHKTLLKIIEKLGAPITMPSANISDMPPSLYFQEIKEEFEGLGGIEDDEGICQIPSTIVDVTSQQVVLVRQGAIAFFDILKCL